MRIFLKSVIFFLLFFSFLLSAHQRSESYSKWIVNEQDGSNAIEVIFTIKLTVLSKLESYFYSGWENQVAEYVISSIDVEPNCVNKNDPRILTSSENNFIKISWTMSCGPGTLVIKNNSFFDRDPTHSHIARLVLNEFSYPEKLFTDQDRTWKVEKTSLSEDYFESSSFRDYIYLGIQHISTGYDHLAFLMGLLLLNQKLKRMLLAVTGFTLGHSLTLGLGVLNYIKPVNSFVEALIGYSIFLVGLEFILRKTNFNSSFLKSIILVGLLLLSFYIFGINGNFNLGLFGLLLFTICYLSLIKKSVSYNLSLLITSFFGLVHGFGFGSYLSEIGLPDKRLVGALFGFNLGVEIGQLLAVGIFILFGLIISNLSPLKLEKTTLVLASSLVALGTFLFLDRIF